MATAPLDVIDDLDSPRFGVRELEHEEPDDLEKTHDLLRCDNCGWFDSADRMSKVSVGLHTVPMCECCAPADAEKREPDPMEAFVRQRDNVGIHGFGCNKGEG